MRRTIILDFIDKCITEKNYKKSKRSRKRTITR